MHPYQTKANLMGLIAATLLWTKPSLASPPTASHPELIDRLTCDQLYFPNVNGGGHFAPGHVDFGLPGDQWTRRDFVNLKARILSCPKNRAAKYSIADNFDILASHAIDPEAMAEQEATRTRDQAVLDAEANKDAAAARTKEVQEKAAEIKRMQTEAAQSARDQERQQEEEAAKDAAAAARIKQDNEEALAENAAAAEALKKIPQPLVFDCAEPEIIQTVKDLITKKFKVDVIKVYNIKPNDQFTSFMASSPLERVRAGKAAFDIPQCAATVITENGITQIAFRRFLVEDTKIVEVRGQF